MPVLLDRSLDIDEEMSTHAAADRQREFIVGRYIDLLADQAVVGGPNAQYAIAETFRLAEAIKGRSVARALDATTRENGRGTAANEAPERKDVDHEMVLCDSGLPEPEGGMGSRRVSEKAESGRSS